MRLEALALQRQRFNLVLDLPDFLLSILQNEQLFQLWMHGPPSYWVSTAASIARGVIRLIKGVQHLFRPRADADVFGQIHPPDGAGGINQEFSRPRDIRTPRPSATMQKIVTTDHFRLCIREQRIPETEFLTLSLIDFRRVDADRDHANASLVEIGKPLLETPQLGVTERSPKPAIKDQHRAVRRNEIGQRDWFGVLIGQRELRRLLTNARRSS